MLSALDTLEHVLDHLANWFGRQSFAFRVAVLVAAVVLPHVFIELMPWGEV